MFYLKKVNVVYFCLEKSNSSLDTFWTHVLLWHKDTPLNLKQEMKKESNYQAAILKRKTLYCWKKRRKKGNKNGGN